MIVPVPSVVVVAVCVSASEPLVNPIGIRSLLQIAVGKHKLLVTPFPDWVPTEVLQAAEKLTEKEAASQLAVVLSLSS